MNIFITGVTGFIGRNFLKELLKTVDQDTVIYTLVRSPFFHEDPRIKLVRASLEQLETCKDILMDCEYVYHLAACADFMGDLPYRETNVVPVEILLRLLKESRKIKNFIFLSTIGVLDRKRGDDCLQPLTLASEPCSTSEYGRSKLEAEKLLRAQTTVPYTIIRPAWVYGEGMRARSHVNLLTSMVYRRHLLSYFYFPGRVPLIHVEDLSTALVRCLKPAHKPGKMYIAVTENQSIGYLFSEIFKEIYGRAPFQIRLPRFHFFFSRTHHYFPLTFSNLFVDYLYAEDQSFIKDFEINKPIYFSQGKKTLVNDHVNLIGRWIITGANSGIGLALAKKVHQQGKHLILVDKEIDELQRQFNNTSHLILKSDLSDLSALTTMVNLISSYKIAVLINNAGVGKRGSIMDLTVEKINEIFDVNVIAPMFLTKMLLRNLIRNCSTIVNISSSVACNPLPHMSIYAASKSALFYWSESLSYELRKTNCVLTLCPSGTHTKFQERSGVKVLAEGKGLLTSNYVAQKILEAIGKRKAIRILSPMTRILLGVTKVLPRKMNTYLWGKLFEGWR